MISIPKASMEMALLNRTDVEQTMDALNITESAGIKEIYKMAGFRVAISDRVPPGEFWVVTDRPSLQLQRVKVSP